MKFGLEAKVGAFVIICLIILGQMAVKLGSFNFGSSSTYNIIAYVKNANGLTEDSKVKFRGVDVGKVTNVSLENGKVKLTVSIKNEYRIPKNVRVAIKSSGFMGNKYLEIEQFGDSVQGELSDNAVVNNSYEATDFAELSNKFGLIADDIKEITAALKTVIASDTGKTQLKGTLENVHETTRVLREMMVQNQERINQIVKNVEELTASMKDISVSNQQNINELIANLKDVSKVLKDQTPKIASNVTSITDNVDEIVGDSKGDIKDTIRNMKVVTAKLEKTVDNVNEITDKINNGDGTVAKLINDNATIEKVNTTLDSLNKMLTQYDRLKLYLKFSGEYYPDTDITRGHFHLKIQPREGKYYLVGVDKSSAGKLERTTTTVNRDYASGGQDYSYTEVKEKRSEDELTFTLQYAQRFFKHYDLRFGLFENYIGAAVDYFPFENEKLELTVAAYDFKSNSDDDETHLFGRVQYNFNKYLFLNGGYDNPLNEDERSYFVGGGFQFLDDDLKMLIGKFPMPTN
jgi:phospholipid/cholesterol/gamma-HCH transport system substrate-binding protein